MLHKARFQIVAALPLNKFLKGKGTRVARLTRRGHLTEFRSPDFETAANGRLHSFLSCNLRVWKGGQVCTTQQRCGADHLPWQDVAQTPLDPRIPENRPDSMEPSVRRRLRPATPENRSARTHSPIAIGVCVTRGRVPPRASANTTPLGAGPAFRAKRAACFPVPMRGLVGARTPGSGRR